MFSASSLARDFSLDRDEQQFDQKLDHRAFEYHSPTVSSPGIRFSVPTADLGLVTRVVPDADLASETTEFAALLAAGPTAAFGSVKRLMVESSTKTLEAQMALETE
ncbi:MAG TPA: hypothetical protein VJX23_07295 [Candidatus Binataceae bacterium]|nr:hypothetical protein [Candidatus Binataceae bacterium]